MYILFPFYWKSSWANCTVHFHKVLHTHNTFTHISHDHSVTGPSIILQNLEPFHDDEFKHMAQYVTLNFLSTIQCSELIRTVVCIFFLCQMIWDCVRHCTWRIVELYQCVKRMYCDLGICTPLSNYVLKICMCVYHHICKWGVSEEVDLSTLRKDAHPFRSPYLFWFETSRGQQSANLILNSVWREETWIRFTRSTTVAVIGLLVSSRALLTC